MSVIIDELKQIATLLNGKQREAYEEMITDAKVVEIVPMSEVFTAQEIEVIKKVVKPKQHECYKNAYQLAMLFSDKVRYCEGKMTVANKLVGIEHAWNKVGNKYIDITMELVLGHDMTQYGEEYVSLGDWGSKELLDISQRMGFYGGVYGFVKSEEKRRIDNLVDNAAQDFRIHKERDQKVLCPYGKENV